ncbi:MAG: adenine phosphoribosyltransferase [Solobacterium sp.]|jgi:adenine phosphoribosyltransferase|nr:adenine phosphoribosyltransferase [Solobacterium sp.]MCH4205518.1 adenine phosphoribosyltransferase [Solobacterium sp.]MCH4227042.1 adenine phosphoribosyltransferase [Solobacterium sp.]MCH4282205.1 adenine phosphoribosyltransferase [Solobacterium sp.]
MALNLEDYIASIPDFPSKGILFRDVTPMLNDPAAFKYAVDELSEFGRKVNADLVIGPESRGFIFGAPVALEMGIGFAPVRKPGKLPRETVSCKYDLEYGSNEVFMHKDAVKPGQRVLIIDDLLATGGTAKASAKMVEELGGVVAGIAFVVELYGNGMDGRGVLKNYEVCSLLKMSDN